MSCLYTAETITLDRLQRVITIYDNKNNNNNLCLNSRIFTLSYIYEDSVLLSFRVEWHLTAVTRVFLSGSCSVH